MGIFSSMAKVTEARARVAVARAETVEPAAALIARGYEYPLTVLGLAAGSGFLMSNVKINPLGISGVSTLVAGGSADILGKIISIAASSVLGAMAGDAADAADEAT